jgi:NAD-dependent DNA ligase
MKHTLKEIVSGTKAKIQYVCDGIVYYNIEVGESIYQLGIDSKEDEWKTTYLYPEFKAITLMRWIRKGMDTDKFIQIK